MRLPVPWNSPPRVPHSPIVAPSGRARVAFFRIGAQRETLLRVLTFTRTAFLALAAIGSLEHTCHPQSPGSTTNRPDASQNSLNTLASAEEKLGTALTCVQSYRSGGKLVVIKGTVYAGISSFTAKKCELTIGTTIVDRYSGQFDKSMIKKRRMSTTTLACFGLLRILPTLCI